MSHWLGFPNFVHLDPEHGLSSSWSATRLLRTLSSEERKLCVERSGLSFSFLLDAFKLGDFSYLSEGNNLLSSPSSLLSDRSLSSPIRSLSARSTETFPGGCLQRTFSVAKKRENGNDRASEGQFQRQWDVSIKRPFFLSLTGCPEASDGQNGLQGACGFPAGVGTS